MPVAGEVAGQVAAHHRHPGDTDVGTLAVLLDVICASSRRGVGAHPFTHGRGSADHGTLGLAKELEHRDEEQASRVVEALRARQVMAHVYRAGTFRFGIRVVLPDEREAIWDDDGTAELEARVMRNGQLVGFVPVVAGSAAFDDAQVVATIAAADYGDG